MERSGVLTRCHGEANVRDFSSFMRIFISHKENVQRPEIMFPNTIKGLIIAH